MLGSCTWLNRSESVRRVFQIAHARKGYDRQLAVLCEMLGKIDFHIDATCEKWVVGCFSTLVINPEV